MEVNKIHNIDCLEGLKTLPDESIHCCVTSPPYFNLRDYGCDGQIGLEDTPEEYITKLVAVFREVKRVLRNDGTLWVNIGDSYNGSGKAGRNPDYMGKHTSFGKKCKKEVMGMPVKVKNCKSKDLIGIPWMLAFALRDDGWYLRQDIIWCLSGGTHVYVKSQKGVMPMMIKDLVRLDPKTVQLWNGDKWVNVLGYGESNDTEEKIEIVLRSGERIGCTGGHKWVLSDNTEVLAQNLRIGNILKSCALPNQEEHKPSFFNKDLLWFLGLYLAEGSLLDDCIQISLNADEIAWVDRISSVATHLGGTCTRTVDGNNLNVRVYSQVLLAVLHQYIGGHNAKTKHLNNIVWQMPNDWLKEIVVGYFDGDGYYDEKNGRVRIGFTRNYNLERDLRVLAARLGAILTLTPTFSKIGDRKYPSFRGEWKWMSSEHWNSKERLEIVEIRKSRARHFYDISVDSEDHLFSLASGVLAHNCKPNPMPESVTDRCTKSHEYIFMLSKSQKYYFDRDAIHEKTVTNGVVRQDSPSRYGGNKYTAHPGKFFRTKSGNAYMDSAYRNKRDVWIIPTQHTKEAHFATFPERLAADCILAGCPENGVVLDPFMGSGTAAVVARKLNRKYIGFELNPEYIQIADKRLKKELRLFI